MSPELRYRLQVSLHTTAAAELAAAVEVEAREDAETVQVTHHGDQVELELGSGSLSRLRALANGYLGLLEMGLGLAHLD